MRLDRDSPTKARLKGRSDAISDLNGYPLAGAKVVARGGQMSHYTTRSTSPEGQLHDHLIFVTIVRSSLKGSYL